MTNHHAQHALEPPLTTQERKQHWGTPALSTGPIAAPLARPLVDPAGKPLLPQLARNLSAEMATNRRIGAITLAIPPVVNLDYAFRVAYEHRGHQLRAEVLWDFTAAFSRQAAGWIKKVAARFFGRSGKGSGAQGEGEKQNFPTNAEQDAPRKYWEQRARFFGAGL